VLEKLLLVFFLELNARLRVQLVGELLFLRRRPIVDVHALARMVNRCFLRVSPLFVPVRELDLEWQLLSNLFLRLSCLRFSFKQLEMLAASQAEPVFLTQMHRTCLVNESVSGLDRRAANQQHSAKLFEHDNLPIRHLFEKCLKINRLSVAGQ
jgi:hypothetical protein